MNKEQALVIDNAQNFLPGSQGEHDFSVLNTASQMKGQLNNFAEQCGGMYMYTGNNKWVLDTCDVGSFELVFDTSKKLTQVIRLRTNKVIWDCKKQRVKGFYGYQEENGDMPYLTEYYGESPYIDGTLEQVVREKA